MLTAGSFIVRHRKKIIAALLILTLLLIIWLDEKELCAPGGDSAGGAGPVSTEGLAYPVDHDVPVTSGFGPRNGEAHDGMDFGGPLGAPVYAFADGVVTDAKDSGVDGFGGWVVILHKIDGREISTVSGHMDPGGVMVQTGDTVKAGDQIARIGNSGYSTGPHLHFEVHEGNRMATRSPVDPAPWAEKAKQGAAGGGGASDSRESGDEDDEEDAGPAENASSQQSAPAAGGSDQEVRDLRASQIIDVGHERDADENVIMSALMAAMVESELRNLASEAVPESKNYPNDGVAAGDADSVGLYQQRVMYWADQAGGIEGLMDPAQQINWYYDTAEGVSSTAPGDIAADVERPDEQYRGKYALREDEARDYYERLADGAAGSLGEKGADQCGGSASLGDAPPADELGRRILAEAKEQFGLPYVWGGGDHNGPNAGQDGGADGFDCSGLTMYAVYQATGGQVAMDHHTNDQMQHENLQEVPWEDRRPGDLIYFGGTEPGNIHHVSIYSGEKDGKDMQYEAQTFGVPVGEYEVRPEAMTVRRVVLPDSGGDNDAASEDSAA